MIIKSSNEIPFPDPLLPIHMEQFQDLKDLFDANPSLKFADHLSSAGRAIIFLLSRLTADQARKLRDLFFAAADSIEDSFPETADPNTPMPEQYATHLRSRASRIIQALDEHVS